ncbi:MAG: hypothetical protein EXR79_17675 [Myxococcales bacterium]|nr:hypothetical protein [Myxococcales bacterium]
MATLAQFLDLTPSAARAQWHAVLSRSPKPRQDPFLPVETILAVALFHVLKPNSYGGGNIDSAPAAVHQLAATCKRTPGSWTSKMLNLDGSREHGQAIEPELFLALHDDFAALSLLYRVILIAAREIGLGEGEVPDFLGLVDAGAHLVPVVRPDVTPLRLLDDAVGRVVRGYHIAEETAERVVRKRAILDAMRHDRGVLAAWQWSCGMCGLTPRQVPAGDVLASIRLKAPPSAMGRELVDPRNSIAACFAHGDALSRGLLGLDAAGNLRLSGRLALDVASEPTVARIFGPGVLLPRVTAPKLLGSGYVLWHTEHRFQAG